MNILIPMAGAGLRFRQAGFRHPKPFISIGKQMMIEHVVNNLRGLLSSFAPRFFLVMRDEDAAYMTESIFGNRNDMSFIVQHGKLDGAVCSCLLAERFIDTDDALVIANADQLVLCQTDQLACAIRRGAGVIATFKASDPKWSYVECKGRNNRDTNYITRVVEKQVISSDATCGIYYYQQGRDFVRAANSMIKQQERVNGEFYVAPTFNLLFNEFHSPYRGGTLKCEVDLMLGLGTPDDLAANKEAVLAGEYTGSNGITK